MIVKEVVEGGRKRKRLAIAKKWYSLLFTNTVITPRILRQVLIISCSETLIIVL